MVEVLFNISHSGKQKQNKKMNGGEDEENEASEYEKVGEMWRERRMQMMRLRGSDCPKVVVDLFQVQNAFKLEWEMFSLDGHHH